MSKDPGMNRAYYTGAIQEIAKDMAVGSNKRHICPACGGGASRERSLSVTRRSETEASFNCFRAKCDLGGGHVAVYMSPDEKVLNFKHSNPVTVAPVHRNLLGLDDTIVNFFADRYLLEPVHLAYGRFQSLMDRRIYMPLFDPRRRTRGHNIRKYKELYVGRREYSTLPKSLLGFYPETEGIALSWYYHNQHRHRQTDTLVLVEDPISSLRLTDYVDSACLFGVAFSDAKQVEIRRQGYRDIVIALDNDATKTAFRAVKSARIYLPNLRVAFLSKDIKDMSHTELEEWHAKNVER